LILQAQQAPLGQSQDAADLRLVAQAILIGF